ncbi:unnamed protein product [Eretmochelys imbricata]
MSPPQMFFSLQNIDSTREALQLHLSPTKGCCGKRRKGSQPERLYSSQQGQDCYGSLQWILALPLPELTSSSNSRMRTQPISCERERDSKLLLPHELQPKQQL